MSECVIEVEKVFQSPSTPVLEVVYLINIKWPEQATDFQRELLAFLEKKTNPLIQEILPM